MCLLFRAVIEDFGTVVTVERKTLLDGLDDGARSLVRFNRK